MAPNQLGVLGPLPQGMLWHTEYLEGDQSILKWAELPDGIHVAVANVAQNPLGILVLNKGQLFEMMRKILLINKVGELENVSG